MGFAICYQQIVAQAENLDLPPVSWKTSGTLSAGHDPFDAWAFDWSSPRVEISDTSTMRSATAKSYPRCKFTQNLAPLPKSLPRRTAISAVTGRLSSRIAYNVCRDIRNAAAMAVLLTTTFGRISSRRISPGCTGSMEGCLSINDGDPLCSLCN